MPKIQDISRSKLIWGLKFLVIGFGLAYVIYYFNTVSVDSLLIFKKFSVLKIMNLIVVLLIFSALNWFGEIKKWQGLVENISFYSSAQQSFIAHGLSLFTPQKLGEYGGKCLFYSKADRYKIISLTAVGHISQLAATLCFGMLGSMILFSELNIFQILTLKWSWVLLIVAVLFMLKPIRCHFNKILDDLKKVKMLKFIGALKWSFFRYLCFAHQFYFLLIIFQMDIGYLTAMSAIGMIYLVASILPIFSIADALVKGSIALSLFGLIGFTETSILVIVLLMWINNVMLPAFLGYLWMFNWRPELFKSKI
jgi:hypothetical protein